MATATADRLEDTIAGDDYGQALGEGEITRILKTVQAAQFKKSETFTAEDTAFKPRSLVEIAFAAEQKRQQEEQAARAAEQAAAAAAAEAAASVKLSAGSAEITSPDSQPPLPQDLPHEGAVPVQETGSQAAPDPAAHAAPDMAAELMQAKAQQAEEEARRQRQQEDEALRLEAEEQGYKRGFEAGLEAARTAEPTAEELALIAEKEQEKQTIVAKFHAAIAALASPQALDSTALSKAINDAVMQLAAERAGQVISQNPEGFLRRIRQLVDRVKAASQQVEVFVNPADLDVLNRWMQDHTAPSGWQFTADAQLDHGDIRLLLGGIEITDILNPVSATPEDNPPAPVADTPVDDAVDAIGGVSGDEQLNAPVSETGLAESSGEASEPKPEGRDDAEQLHPEPVADVSVDPRSEDVSAPASESAPESAPEAVPEQSPEQDSE